MSSPAPAPILIIGRAGQLATDLADCARERKAPFVAVGRPAFDLAHPDAAARALDWHRPRAVINAAAYTNVDRAESEGELAFAINAIGPGLLAQACARAGVPLIHVSTDQVFDGSKEAAYTEEDRPNPINLYGRSKLAGDEAVPAALPEALVARVSWVWGPSGDNFVKKVLAWARTRDTLQIVSDQRGRPTYSPELAQALLDLADRNDWGSWLPASGGVLNLAGASVLTRDAQVRLVLEQSRLRGGPFATVFGVPTSDFPTPAAGPLNAELDIGKARTLGGIAMDSFEADLSRCLDAASWLSTPSG